MPSTFSHFIEGANGDKIQFFYQPPVRSSDNPLPDKSVPLVLIIHGGPQGAVLNSWSFRWNLGIFSSSGFGVVAVNFHGSTGYGQNFTDSIHGQWGGAPYMDCLAAVDAVTDRYKYIDPDRVGAAGASYGGYMVNWMNGNTERFKCLVNHDGIFDLKSFYFATEELYFPEWEFGMPWSDSSSREYGKWSPSQYVEQWKTPCLVIHGGKDYRVVESEGIATFTALQRQGVPSKMLFFPDENHWVLKEQNSILWHRTVIDWLHTYLDGDNLQHES